MMNSTMKTVRGMLLVLLVVGVTRPALADIKDYEFRWCKAKSSKAMASTSRFACSTTKPKNRYPTP